MFPPADNELHTEVLPLTMAMSSKLSGLRAWGVLPAKNVSNLKGRAFASVGKHPSLHSSFASRDLQAHRKSKPSNCERRDVWLWKTLCCDPSIVPAVLRPAFELLLVGCRWRARRRARGRGLRARRCSRPGTVRPRQHKALCRAANASHPNDALMAFLDDFYIVTWVRSSRSFRRPCACLPAHRLACQTRQACTTSMGHQGGSGGASRKAKSFRSSGWSGRSATARSPCLWRETQWRGSVLRGYVRILLDTNGTSAAMRRIRRRSRVAGGRAPKTRRLPGAPTERAAAACRVGFGGRPLERAGAQIRTGPGTLESPPSPPRYLRRSFFGLGEALVDCLVCGDAAGSRQYSLGRPLVAPTALRQQQWAPRILCSTSRPPAGQSRLL